MRCFLLAALALCSVAHAASNDYPSKPIRLLVPFPPGGASDALARIITPKLTERLGQTWVVDNRGGAGGNMATEVVVTALPDGYSVLLGFNTALVVNPALYKLPFFPGFELTSWYAFMLPAKTPRAIVMRLFDEAQSAVKLPDVQEAFARQGIDIDTSASPEAFAAEIKSETAAWAKLVQSSGIKAD